MNILETVTLYWNEFGIIYNTVLSFGAWKIISILTPSLLVLGTIRSAYHYAKGNKIGQFHYSMFVLRLGDRLLTLVGGQDKTMFKRQAGWDENRAHRLYDLIPIGSSFVGMVLDVAAFTVLSLICFLIWPGVLFIFVTIGPLHICRVHNLRKKAFIAKLKGEEVNA